ncbi:hypothetical protein [Hymenobacter terrestris]|uniref:Uncharacterized protein n=1 Tax=Hymenobacter terrestris TaxID=2748310 RepID=A0ABX2Q520_9BACT|nr:hypothetical protein [Hymenobacter terrestris]NVO86078.1 hypothetical protein [Hymenobacter terrestris]
MLLLLRRCLIVFGTLALLLPALRVRAQEYYLDLSHQTITLPSRTVHVEQVVDGRPGKPTIGLVYRGLDNRAAAVLFRRGLEPELTDFLRQQLPPRPNDHPIVLCLRQLRVGELLNGTTEKASADLAADVYVRLPDGYHFMRSVGAHTSSRALETTRLHPAHVALLLQQCLEQLTTYSWEKPQLGPALTLPQLPAHSPGISLTAGPGTELPAILREAPRRGVYRTFAQFLTNKPDTLAAFRLDTLPTRRWGGGPGRALWLGTVRFEPKLLADGAGQPAPALREIWGLSDGQRVLVQYEKNFYHLQRQADFFTFVGEKPQDLEYLRARADAQMRAGAVGVAQVRAIDHSGEPMAYALDMRSGQPGAYPNPLRAAPAQTDTAYVYLYRPADGSVAAVPVFLQGQQVGQLLPNEYLEIPWPYYAQLMSLRLGPPITGARQLFVPDATRLSYLKVQTDATTVHWEWVSAGQAEADLDAIDRQRHLPSR